MDQPRKGPDKIKQTAFCGPWRDVPSTQDDHPWWPYVRESHADEREQG
jgi:hypothetical protein